MTAGPFETEREVIDAIGLRTWQPGQYAERGELALLEACAAAGIELGAYDRRIVAWLATMEPQACAVVAGMILRASQAAWHEIVP